MHLEESHWAALSPIIAYWVVSGFYEFLDYSQLWSRYRIRAEGYEKQRNLVSRGKALRHVLMYQAVQTGLLFALLELFPAWTKKPDSSGLLAGFVTSSSDPLSHVDLGLTPELHDWLSWTIKLASLLARQLFALVVLDTWVFWGHYVEHQNVWLYRNIHAVHHQLYIPFSYGALYNHWFESLCVDGIGGMLAVEIAGLSDQEAIWFYALVTAKTVEDHCAFQLPWSPFVLFGRLTGATVVYHNIHHERWGLKTNFQIYFTWWDRLLGSDYRGSRTINGKETIKPAVKVSDEKLE